MTVDIVKVIGLIQENFAHVGNEAETEIDGVRDIPFRIFPPDRNRNRKDS